MKKIIIPIFIGILILSYSLYFRNNNEAKVLYLEPIDSINLNVPEPSGLYFDKSKNILFTASDETSKIYLLNLSGKIIKTINVDGFDLEGISKINDTTIVTILERDRAVVALNDNGIELNRFKINLTGELNKGLEGITVNKEEKTIYILNEKDPGILIKCDFDGKLIKKIPLNFFFDYSGIDYVHETQKLWITSDESEAIAVCDIEGNVLNKYKFNIEQIEGIAIDYDNKLIYLISDPLNTLYIFNIPD